MGRIAFCVAPTITSATEVLEACRLQIDYKSAIQMPDNSYVTNKFALTGLLTNTFGSRTYPVAYTYDAQGRVKTMTTWTSYTGSTGAATTTWNYDQYRGWLTNKSYADGSGPVYSNTPAGRLSARLWARGTNTSYSYNLAGDLSGVTYNDGATSSLTYGYDRRGRQTSTVQGSTTTTRTFDDPADLLIETYSGGLLSGFSVTNGFDQFLRRTNLMVRISGFPLFHRYFGFYSASRLLSVDDGTNTISYSYIANSPLV